MTRVATLIALAVVFAPGLLTGGETMPLHVAQKLGLEQAWLRQLQIPAGAQSIVHQEIFVHLENQHEFVEIVDSKPAADGGEKVWLRINTDRIGANGLEIGKAEAERLARAENRRLKRRSITGKITSRKVPKIRLYTLGDDGTVECRDAESGEPVWMSRVGDRRLGYLKFGVGEKYLTVINGGNLIKLDVLTGEEMQSVRTTRTPLFGAVHAGDYSLVPTIRNGVEGYPLNDPSRYPFMEIVQGLALSPPTKAPGTTRVAWGTERGFVYVMELQGTPSVLFRLDTDGIVKGRVVATAGDYFYFASASGQVYALRATRVGKVIWSRPYGEPFYHDPMIVGDKLLLRSVYGNLFSLTLADGISTWTAPVSNIDQLLAAFDGKIYTRLLSGGVAVIDLESGDVSDVIYDVLPQTLLTNAVTDRLYLVSETGAVQCMRTIGKTLPTITSAMNVPEEKPATKPDTAAPVGPTPVMDKAADPFGAPADPFGAAPAAGADPFGAPADPFGAPAAGDDKAADPFGADPFGN